MNNAAGSVSFFIKGLPKPQARPKFARMGRFVKTYSPKTDWFQVCYYTGLEQRRKAPAGGFTGPLRVCLDFALPRPKSANKRVIWPAVRPDLDNYEKAVLDALTQSGIWRDDGLICDLHSTKSYSVPGADTGCSVQVEDMQASSPSPTPAEKPESSICKCGAKFKSCPWGEVPHTFCPVCDEFHITEHRDEFSGGD